MISQDFIILFRNMMGRKKTSSIAGIMKYSQSEMLRMKIRRRHIQTTFQEIRADHSKRKNKQNPENNVSDAENIRNFVNRPFPKNIKEAQKESHENKNQHQNLYGVRFPINVGYNAPTKLFPEIQVRYHINNNVYNYGHIQNAQCGQKIQQQPYINGNIRKNTGFDFLKFDHEVLQPQETNNALQAHNFYKNKQQIPQKHQEIKKIAMDKKNLCQMNISKQFQNQKIYTRFQNYIVFNKLLGSGSYSKVYLGLELMTQTKVAVKEVSQLEQNQIKCLMSVDSPYVIKLRSYWKNSQNKMTYLILDFCKSNLRQQLKLCDKNKALKYFDDIVKGINALMKKNLVHRDLKFENILISTQEVAKITDFGLAKDLGNMSNIASLRCGTPYTMAPEILFHNGYGRARYSHKCDIWSMGVILHQILYRKHPFNYDSDKVYRMDRVTVPQNNGLYDTLINRSLVKDPEQRIAWSQFYDIYQEIRQLKKKKDETSNLKIFKRQSRQKQVNYSDLKIQARRQWGAQKNQRNFFKRNISPDIQKKQEIPKIHKIARIEKKQNEKQKNYGHQIHKHKIDDIIQKHQFSRPFICEHQIKKNNVHQQKQNPNKKQIIKEEKKQINNRQIGRFQNFRFAQHIKASRQNHRKEIDKEMSKIINQQNKIEKKKKYVVSNIPKNQENFVQKVYFPPRFKPFREDNAQQYHPNLFSSGLTACFFVFVLLFMIGKALGI